MRRSKRSPYSITSSASCWRWKGTSRPSALGFGRLLDRDVGRPCTPQDLVDHFGGAVDTCPLHSVHRTRGRPHREGQNGDEPPRPGLQSGAEDRYARPAVADRGDASLSDPAIRHAENRNQSLRRLSTAPPQPRSHTASTQSGPPCTNDCGHKALASPCRQHEW